MGFRRPQAEQGLTMRENAGKVAILFAVAWAFLHAALGTAAAEPDGPLTLVPQWFHVISKPGEQAVIILESENTGPVPIEFSVSCEETPPGWDVQFKGNPTSYEIRGISLVKEEERNLTLEVNIPEDAQPGDYGVTLKASTDDGGFEATLPITITVVALSVVEPEGPGAVELEEPRYTSLTGPNDGEFAFNVVVRNRTLDPVNLDLGSIAPPGWRVNSRPAFAEGRRITSVSITPGAGETVTVDVEPPAGAFPGKYEVQFLVNGPNTALSTPLEVVLTGRNELSVNAPSGRLNAKAAAGQQTPITILVTNSGTIALNAVSLISQAPTGWEVSFEPPVVDTVEAGATQEVIAQLEPPSNAVPGDYGVSIVALSGLAGDSMELVVAVTQSTVWRWVGAALVILVLGGLTSLFIRLGKR